MKPVVTWIVLANARSAKVLAHFGFSKGLVPVADQEWVAPKVPVAKDRAGLGHSIAGPGVAAMEQTDLKAVYDAKFAKTIITHIAKAQAEKRFDRLIVIASPHMLGLLRSQFTKPIRDVLVGEVSKDLLHQPCNAVAHHLDELIAV